MVAELIPSTSGRAIWRMTERMTVQHPCSLEDLTLSHWYLFQQENVINIELQWKQFLCRYFQFVFKLNEIFVLFVRLIVVDQFVFNLNEIFVLFVRLIVVDKCLYCKSSIDKLNSEYIAIFQLCREGKKTPGGNITLPPKGGKVILPPGGFFPSLQNRNNVEFQGRTRLIILLKIE